MLLSVWSFVLLCLNRSDLSCRGDSFAPIDDPHSSRIVTSSPPSEAQRVSSRAPPAPPGPHDPRGAQRVPQPRAALCADTNTAACPWDPEATAVLFRPIVVYSQCTQPRYRASGGVGPSDGDRHNQRTPRHACSAFPYANPT